MRITHFLNGGDAGINGNDQADALFRQLPDGAFAQPIAFVQPVRYVIRAVSVLCPQVFDQNGGGSHAINVIIAIHGNFIAMVQCILYDINSFCHIRQQHGVEKILWGFVEIARSAFAVLYPARCKDA